MDDDIVVDTVQKNKDRFLVGAEDKKINNLASFLLPSCTVGVRPIPPPGTEWGMMMMREGGDRDSFFFHVSSHAESR